MFTFKQFTIHDEHCAMKVGTDGVLLGAWANIQDKRHILDIGCGSGLIALMAAQRALEAQVAGVEIDLSASKDAEENVRNSPFSNRMQIVCADILQWAKSHAHQYDYILSNPPYHVETLLPPSASRAKARHTDGGGLTFEALLHAVSLLLAPNTQGACFSVILPAPSVCSFIASASAYSLELSRKTNIVTRPGKPAKRVLLEFCLSTDVPSIMMEDQLHLVGDNGKRSPQYEDLCKDFYL